MSSNVIRCDGCGRNLGNGQGCYTSTDKGLFGATHYFCCLACKQKYESLVYGDSSGPGYYQKECNKWVALILCFLFGFFGAHKFYEGKKGKGVLYLCTMGLFGFGYFIDLIILLFKPNPYYV